MPTPKPCYIPDGVELVLSLDREGRETYPVFLANSARVFQIPGPRQAQSSLLEVTIREHVRQTERVVVLLWKKFPPLASFKGRFVRCFKIYHCFSV